MKASLVFGDNSLEISGFQHFSKEFQRGNPYNTAFTLTVRSGKFCGLGKCEYDIVHFCEFVEELKALYDFQRNNACMEEICYGSIVNFVSDNLGHIEISGKAFGYAMEHALQFVFEADQTGLKTFIEELDGLIRSAFQ